MNNKQYLTARVMYYEDKISTDFHGKKNTQNGSNYFCVTVILIDFVYNVHKDYYPQVYLEECKYIKVLKRKKIFKKFK